MQIMVNGERREVEADTDTPLLWVLRDDYGLTGTKYGCGKALCGACTVHMDGRPVRACVTPVSAVGSAEVTTIEALDSAAGKAVRAAWLEFDVAQCGYCQSGQVMAAAALLTRTPAPSDADIVGALNGNICRCATYARIRRAVKRAAELLA